MSNRNAERPAQREVAVKKPGFSSFSPARTLAFSLIKPNKASGTPFENGRADDPRIEPEGPRSTRQQSRRRSPIWMGGCAAAVLLALPCYGQEPEVKPKPADAPLVLQYPNGSALLNKAAFDKIDLEMKRLQQVEREHKAEPSWLIPVAIGAGAGLVVGAVVSAVIVGSLTAK